MKPIRRIVCGALLGLSLCGAGTAPAASTAPVAFSIQKQALQDALTQFGEQSGYQLLFLADITSQMTAPEVVGKFTPQDALEQLLDKSGLRFQFVNERTIAISQAGSRASSQTDPASNGVEDAQMKNQNAENISGTQVQTGSMRLVQAGESSASSQTPSAEEKNKVEEIIVTAQRRQERAIDVPISITALSGEKLKEAGIKNAQDLSFSVPSMSVQEIGPGRQIITIRGVGSQRGSSSLTGVYVDEMSVSGLQDDFISTYLDLRTTDLERVEVLKGPQGTLFGEGSVGGTVRFVTKDPELDRVRGSASASVLSSSDSSGTSQEFSGVLNVPLVDDVLGLRVAATYENEAGWIDKLQTVNGPVIQSDFNDSELAEVRVKGLWKPTQNLAIKAMAIIHRNDTGGSNIVNLEPRSASNFIIEFEPTAPTGSTDDYDLYNLNVTYDFGFAEFLNSTSYSKTEGTASLSQRRPIIPNPTPGFQEILQRDYALNSDAFSQEIRLSSRGEGALNWTAGAYYKDAKLSQRYISGVDFVRFGMFAAPRGFNSGIQPTFKSKSWAAFGDATYKLSSNWELGGGVRYFNDDRDSYDALAANVSATQLAGTFDATTYRAFLSHGFTDDIKVYGSVSTGFRSGGLNSSAVRSIGGPPTYKPETVISYELGTKMSLAGGTVSLESAVFYSKYVDIQGASTFTTIAGVPQPFVGNPGEAEIRGIDWSLNWAVLDQLTLSLNGDVTDSEITKVGQTLTPPPLRVGDPLDFMPEYSFAAGLDYDFSWTQAVPGYVRVQFSQQGESSQSLRNIDSPIQQDRTPVLHFLNASVGGDIGGWNVELLMRNILDEDGALRPGSGLTPQARPRTVGIRVEKAF